ncbi:MAG: response regulator transcription factor [Chloroflexota bacterium]
MGTPVADQDRRPRVLVVDDELTMREYLELGLGYEGFEVRLAVDGSAAMELARSWIPDLVILDRMLPGTDGLDVCRSLRASGDVGILMLTARGDVDDRVDGLEAGADDYLAKPFTFKELLARVRAILRRRGVVLGRRLRAGPLTLDRETREVAVDGRPIALTPREFELLELLLSHPRQVLTREAIMNRIWGYEYEGDANVIEVHIHALREKLGDQDRTLIAAVRGVGYSLRG